MFAPTKRITWLLVVATLSCLVLLCVSSGMLWILPPIRRVGGDFWAMLAAVAQAITACTVVGTAVFAVRQLQDADFDRNVDMADRLFSSLNAPACIAARRWVYTHLPDHPPSDAAALTAITESWVQDGQEQVKIALNSLDHVAFLLQAGSASGQSAIPDEIVMPWMSAMVVKSWQWLGPYVLHIRKIRHEEDYYRTVESLAQRCTAWRQRNNLPIEFKAIEKTT